MKLLLRRKRNVKEQSFIPKHPFFFTLETVLKLALETNKEEDVENTCATVTKHASKQVAEAEVNLN